LFDPFSLQQNGLSSAEVDVGRREIVQALVIAAMIVVIDEGVDPGFQVAGRVIPAGYVSIFALRHLETFGLASPNTT
jgi:hypothetical protein